MCRRPSGRHAVHPLVDHIEGAGGVRLTELVSLRPAERGVPQPLLHQGVEPGEKGVQPTALGRGFVYAAGRDGLEEVLQIGLDTRRRLDENLIQQKKLLKKTGGIEWEIVDAESNRFIISYKAIKK